MDYLAHKRANAARRTNRVRTGISDSLERPRLSVFVSNLHVTAQIIDDVNGKTLAYATSVGQKVEGGMSAKAVWVGKEIADKGKKAKIQKVVFDKGRYKYHGRVKALAESARQHGLEF